MSRRENGRFRCARCKMLGGTCICALIPRIETRTRVVLVLHKYEARKTTNTGQLAAASLVNSEIVVRGHEGEPSAPLVFGEDVQPLVLFPHPDAVSIERFADSERPVVLVVPDGTWRQASKVRKRVPGLRDVPCVTLPPGTRSSYRLRVDAHDEGLATLEGIARALRILEGERGEAVHDALEGIFRVMVERTLWTRGLASAEQIAGGIPEGARRDRLE